MPYRMTPSVRHWAIEVIIIIIIITTLFCYNPGILWIPKSVL